jgi:type IV pilus assembly protein PilO
MADILEQLQKTPTPQKMAVVGLLIVGMGVGYYFGWYSDFDAKERSLGAQYAEVTQEITQYEARKRDYLRFKNEVARLIEEQKELLRVLPRKAEIPTFLDSLYNQAEPLGLEITLFSRQQEKVEELYVRIPVQIEMVGSFHQILRFFNKVSALPRIVNIEDVSLTEPVGTDSGVRLKAKFLAVTFRFSDRPPRKG